MYTFMRTNAIDMRTHMKEIFQAIDRNETVIITYHGKDKAKISPITSEAKIDITQHSFFGLQSPSASNTKKDVLTDLDTIRQNRF